MAEENCVSSAELKNATGVVYIDCHCHLADKDFDKDIEEVVTEAKKTGVKAALVCATSTGEFEKVLTLADRFPDFVLPCFGVHPVQGALTGDQKCVTLQDLEEAVPLIEKYHDRLGAIGECGLDFQPRITQTAEDKDVQRQVLSKQVELANKYDLPLNVHSRSAGRPTIALLKEQGAKKVLMHAFDGNPKYAMEGVKEGYFFSIPPSIIRSEQQKLVKALPVESLLLETDSPALGPQKQERNVPSNIAVSCNYIAEVKQMDPGQLSRLSTQNALKLFPKLARFVVK
ncbi:putative deoxyribonuclease TATDN3 isoform X2 [Mercenaria mercenaria]|uniref:putative deoxyribonuclease TATDN3 isoform X2 n=1 Tax=Mercenaria mercenaria TaxID=6596 RepID=UPI00234F6DAD|nr:putative deoxyribonuclease TATDN3 isoform X2 [Mercenaria mercenaria]